MSVRRFLILTLITTAALAQPTGRELHSAAQRICGYGSIERSQIAAAAAEPFIVVTSPPDGLAQQTNLAGGFEELTIANLGGTTTTVQVSRTGTFFDVTPIFAHVQPGGTATFAVVGNAQPAGYYEGTISLTGPGVASGTELTVRLVSANRPSTPPLPRPLTNRVDVACECEIQTSQVTFTNDGTGTVRGVFSSDVPWILPPEGVFEFAGQGNTAEVQFQVDPSKRPDEISTTGTLSLQYLLSPGEIGKGPVVEGHDSTGVSSSTVTVVATVPPTASPAAIPPIGAGEVAYFAPGVGRLVGSVGLFISDLTVSSLRRDQDFQNVRLYYAPIDGSSQQTANIGTVSRTVATPLGDLVKGVFGIDGKLGTLQVRSPDARELGVVASIFNSSDPAGTFGTGIPIFRSDRGIDPGERSVLTGLRKNATSHTNVFVQETSGATSRVKIRWLAAGGGVLGERIMDLVPFGLAFLNDPFTEGAVSAIVEHENGSSGAFAAYATPVDRASGDFWAVADWSHQYGTSAQETVVIPVAGSVSGALGTDFRTDISMVNPGATPASGVLTYREDTGVSRDATIELQPGETQTAEDFTRTLFGIQGRTLGYLKFAPETGSIGITARTYNLVSSTSATYGAAVPVLPLTAALRPGQVKRFGGIEDASIAAVNSARPATFRSNLGMVETSGRPVRIRATMSYTVPSALVTAFGSAAAEFSLQPGESRLIQRVSAAILGDFRGAFGDLHNLQIDFEVIEGDGEVVLFFSTIDNGTGDSILRTE